MSRTIEITVKEIEPLMEAIGQAATATASEGEDINRVKKFKYAAGKNYNKLRSIAKAINQRQLDMQDGYSDKEFDEYNVKRTEICESHAEREDSGKIVYKQGADGGQRYAIAKALKTDFDIQIKELGGEYKEALARYRENEDKTAAVLDEEIAIELFTISWEMMPIQISGGYADAITPMLTDVPIID